MTVTKRPLIVLLITTILMVTNVFSQKQSIDHTTYNQWKTIPSFQISDKGNVTTHVIKPYRGDESLHIKVNSKEESVFHRGNKAKISQDEKVVLFHIQPGFDTLRSLELKKVKKEKQVKDSLGVFFTETRTHSKIANLKEFKIAEKGNVYAYLIDKDSLEIQSKKKKSKKKKKNEITSKGNTLFVTNTTNDFKQEVKHVSSFAFNPHGSHLLYVSHKEENKKDEYQIHLFNTSNECHTLFEEKFTEITAITSNENNTFFFFLASIDTSSKNKVYEAYLWNIEEEKPERILDKYANNKDSLHTVSTKPAPYFSKDGERIIFGLKNYPKEEEKDTLLAKEKAKLDLWHYKDVRLQTQQLAELKRDKERSLLSVYFIKDKTYQQIEENKNFRATLNLKGNGDFALLRNNEKYQHANNWRFPWPNDYYSINVKTGEKKLLKEEIAYGQSLTPNGEYFVYFNSPENNYYAVNTATLEEKCMTCSDSTINWQADINGMPFEANPEGYAGYFSDNEVALYDRNGIWLYNFSTNSLTPIASEEGMKFKVHHLDRDNPYLNVDNILILGTNQTNFDETIYQLNKTNEGFELLPLYTSNHTFSSISKAKEGQGVLFRKQNTLDFPDIYLTDINFKNPAKISNANPQQQDYIWTQEAKIIDWKSYNGEDLRGLVYLPEDFDTTKSYPLLVYFYETYTENKNRHYTPRPTASIIFATEYASAGYVVFMPDIHYRPGQPGKDAYNSIMSGTDKMLELYPNIDSTRMGLQGQSWGGYQTAQLITMTNRYKAAMAGAPVSNMLSAYGGIRWTSGLNRMFQYEHTQSRIGKTIWEDRDRYVENSPLYGVPKIETPLLIMHNDNDGAVPWYQGIELFVAMKRLDRPVWMLNYNGDEHNLMKPANRMDLSIRMRQFFDHYLLDKEAPDWLLYGIPAMDKEKNHGIQHEK